MHEDRSTPYWAASIRETPQSLAPHHVLAAATPVRDALAQLEARGDVVLLVPERSALYLLTRGDLERVLPSPATALARHEIAELLGRVTLRHALRAPAATIGASASLRDAVATLRAGGWRPVVVREGEQVVGVLSAESVLDGLRQGDETRAEAVPHVGVASR